MTVLSRNVLLGLFLLSVMYNAVAGHHQDEHMEHSEMTHEQKSSSCADDDSCEMAHGIVVSLNKDKKKIVLDHGEIKKYQYVSYDYAFQRGEYVIDAGSFKRRSCSVLCRKR